MHIDEPRGPKGQDLAHFGPIWRPFAPNLGPFWPFLAHFGPFWPRLARFGPEIRIALNEKNAARAAKFFQLRYLSRALYLCLSELFSELMAKLAYIQSRTARVAGIYG